MMHSQRLLRHLSVLRTTPALSVSSMHSASAQTAFCISSSLIHSSSRKIPRTTFRHHNPRKATMSTQLASDDIVSHYSNLELEGNNVGHAMEMLAKADAVCFDVDSTVIDEEGIDVLADTLGKGPQVAAWTTKAMSGNTKFEDALAARLEIIRPSQSDIATCLEKHPLRLSPGVDRLVAALQKRGTDVYLVSGGFRLMINPVADSLNIPLENIYANTILFDGDGTYSGFDATEPTSADQGKPKALGIIKEKFGYKTMIMVGDGATDAQAKPPADAFIGFGGVVVRDAVKEKACWFIRDFETMIDIVSRSR